MPRSCTELYNSEKYMIDRLIREFRRDWGPEQLTEALSPYRLGEPVATDGEQAVVFAAHSIEPFEAVGAVIKLPCTSGESSILHSTFEDRVAALREEARVMGKCRGADHVVQVLADRTASEFPHLVLERLGESLETRIEASAPGDADSGLSVVDALVVMRDAAAGLQAIHQVGECHQDVKPGNILWSLGRGWVLIDPTTPDYFTEEYLDRWFMTGRQRDFVALGRTFLAA